MVRAYAGCVGGITFPASNTSTMAGVPACTAPTALSEYQFGPKGTCSVQVDQRDEFPCAGSCGFACANLYVRAKCKDIRDSGGSLIQGAGWALRLIARATVGDASAGDMTLIDFFPLELAFQPPTNGALKLKTDLNSQLFDPCIGYPAPFAACATIHWKVMAIIDPSGDVFAVTGSSSR
jgi:hypothetical protein